MLQTFRHLANQVIECTWIVENLISPGGWTFLVGPPKLGKSLLMLQLCKALQEGESFLGMDTAQHNCLYIQADAGLVEWHQQIKTIAPESAAWTNHQLDAGFLDSELERRRLHELVWGQYTVEVQGEKAYKNFLPLQGKRFTFIIVDCLHKITYQDFNSRASALQVLGWLDDIATRKRVNDDGDTVVDRVHYVLIHHPAANEKHSATSGAGSKLFSALCTTKLCLVDGALILEGSKLCKGREIALERAQDGSWILPRGYEGSDVSRALEAALASPGRSNGYLEFD